MGTHNRGTMAKRGFLFLSVFSILVFGGGAGAQDDASRIRVNVVLVQLNVAVTDRKGNYVSGLRPEDFEIVEDKIPEKLATFEEGNEPTRRLINVGPDSSRAAQGAVKTAEPGGPELAGQSGTSFKPRRLPGLMCSSFLTQVITCTGDLYSRRMLLPTFIRSLEGVSKVALYSYSRDLSRVSTLTPDRSQVLRGVRSTVAGDDAALYNCLLMTVKDAAQLTGRKAIVVFSNGPDNASLVPPEDVAELAQSTGTIIYMISTRQAEEEPVSTAVFERMSKATGGKAYFSKDWKDEKQAFASIRDDLAHLYALSYYPQPNSNHGWRSITVKLVGKDLQKYHIRTRDGYRLLQQTQASSVSLTASGSPSSQ